MYFYTFKSTNTFLFLFHIYPSTLLPPLLCHVFFPRLKQQVATVEETETNDSRQVVVDHMHYSNERRRCHKERPKDHLPSFNLNDNVDVLTEILCRLDGRSLSVAACVCRMWNTMCRRDTVWERLCGGSVAAAAERSVVVALGGYRRLYRVCVGPALDRMSDVGRKRIRWGPHEVQLSMSLFSIDCYERRLVGKRRSSSSLMFLFKAK